PDLILWTLSPWDVQNVTQTQDVLPLAEVDRNGGPPPPKWRRYLSALRSDGLGKLLLGTRSVLMMRYLLYQSRSEFMHSYLMQTDESGIFAKEAPAAWRQRWGDLDAIAKDMEEQAKAAGVPFAVTAVPDLAGALMLSSSDWAPQLDPQTFGDRIRSIAERHGGVYLDVLSAFGRAPDPERLYFVVDGHMNQDAHALLSRLLADRLTSGVFSVLKKQGTGAPAAPAGQ
ncbi:MAG TPA: SGNH/GDSL hydrolase family protein, partial [Candidatus Sulfopaludibacter sp.]|nr:SGNH/GDSL hydrolase family protein [Candidatus Sulfopaludibacter sp.]